MPTSCPAGAVIANALRVILRRDNREKLYIDALTEQVDAVRYPVLSGIVSHGPLSAAALGRMVGLDRSVVSRHVDHLEAAGLVHRTPQGRETQLEATPAGRETVDNIHDALASRIGDIISEWPQDLQKQFTQGIQRFAAALSELPPSVKETAE